METDCHNKTPKSKSQIEYSKNNQKLFFGYKMSLKIIQCFNTHFFIQ